MKKLNILGCFILLLLVSHAARAQNKSGWSCSETGWQYDMTVFAVVAYSNGSPVEEQSNYEVAAFVGDECRGVADIWTAGTSKVFYLRVHSNTTSGENITFKVFDKTENSESSLITFDAVTFTNDATIGEASAPLALKRNVDAPYVMGDVNGDGSINSVDLSLMIGKILGKVDARFIDAAGDLDGNSQFNSVDLSLLIKLILSH